MKVSYQISAYIIGTEFCVCVVYYGIGRNLSVYLKTELFEDSVTAAAQASMWQGTCFATTLIGAYVADSYWGNYLTLVSFLVIFFIVSIQFYTMLFHMLMIRLCAHTHTHTPSTVTYYKIQFVKLLEEHSYYKIRCCTSDIQV